MRRYTILGTTDDRTACELCGRVDLKHTVALRDNETDEIVYYGSDCAARAAGWTIKEVRDSVRDAARAAARERQATQSAATGEWLSWLAAETGEAEPGPAIQALGGFAAARAAYNARSAA